MLLCISTRGCSNPRPAEPVENKSPHWKPPDGTSPVLVTGEAVDQAVQEFKREAAGCYDHTLRSLPEDAGFGRQALKDAKAQLVELAAEMCSETMRALRRVANANIKHAVACVEDPNEVPVMDHFVADELLGAKMGTLPQTDGASASQSGHCAASMLDCDKDGGADGSLANHCGRCQVRLDPGSECVHHSNPGSLGHPEMCVWPCQHFSRGQCTSGDGCRFCHCPHPTRAAHLGTRHRRTWEAMTTARVLRHLAAHPREEDDHVGPGHRRAPLTGWPAVRWARRGPRRRWQPGQVSGAADVGAGCRDPVHAVAAGGAAKEAEGAEFARKGPAGRADSGGARGGLPH
ncbi:unnamed protein product [Prorocentrum cordatum]|nr:unnamed protein product [Polarella glacialis]